MTFQLVYHAPGDHSKFEMKTMDSCLSCMWGLKFSQWWLWKLGLLFCGICGREVW